MDAVAALNEIAFWLERGRAATFKVQAFRKAAAAISPLPPEEVAERARTGRLKSMKGIGDRTYQVIREAVEGQVPEYLADLREKGSQPLASGGGALREALRGDLHSHSDWSDGGSPIELMAAAAGVLGREYLALTDHSPNLTIANGLSAERLLQQLDVVAAINDGSRPGPDSQAGNPARLLTGIEVDILESGELDQDPELLDRLDIVVASVHSKLRADRKTMTRRMLGGIQDPHTNVLGHCTGRLVEGSRGTRPPSEFDAKEVFAACAEHNVAVEINSRPERQDPPDALMQLALEAGCLFSIDSDAHAPGQLDFLQYGAERAERNGVPAERIITTWPVDRLLAWAAGN
ncbi:PHP domain-containing protein [Pseudarthrobacter phenanthrenivorans]|uniref:PHP domain-containing protein n=2 Tax=Pseudarthrobacter phenanthrenivorans TaxID=361575 RepID=A0A3B0FR26_PSEPS|nr:PHP domain-containing protein [Pseudarthrobacter phenanthrenivorans]ADX71719.1 PHP family phosphohydrolase, histidinol phosphatase [Pseudarthrobacter phenanthrenivorans Sphe3]RKO22319.1 PHP domain-containing protein [Pseudarthrobacter phenanthrenivorans]